MSDSKRGPRKNKAAEVGAAAAAQAAQPAAYDPAALLSLYSLYGLGAAGGMNPFGFPTGALGSIATTSTTTTAATSNSRNSTTSTSASKKGGASKNSDDPNFGGLGTLGVAASQAASLGMNQASAAWWAMASQLAAQEYLMRLQAASRDPTAYAALAAQAALPNYGALLGQVTGSNKASSESSKSTATPPPSSGSPASFDSLKLPSDTEIIKYTSSATGSRNPGNSNRGRKKTISLDQQANQMASLFGNYQAGQSPPNIPAGLTIERKRPGKHDQDHRTASPVVDKVEITKVPVSTNGVTSQQSRDFSTFGVKNSTSTADAPLNLSLKTSSNDLSKIPSEYYASQALSGVFLAEQIRQQQLAAALESRLETQSFSAMQAAMLMNKLKAGAETSKLLAAAAAAAATTTPPTTTASTVSVLRGERPKGRGRNKQNQADAIAANSVTMDKLNKDTVASLLAKSREQLSGFGSKLTHEDGSSNTGGRGSEKSYPKPELTIEPIFKSLQPDNRFDTSDNGRRLASVVEDGKLKIKTISDSPEIRNLSDHDDDNNAHSGDESGDEGSGDDCRGGGRYATVETQELRLPLRTGWKRETTVREYSKSGIRGDVVYYAPCGKKFKQYPDIMRYLEKKGTKNLMREHFSFSTKIFIGDFLRPTGVSENNGEEKYVRMTENEILDEIDKLRRENGWKPRRRMSQHNKSAGTTEGAGAVATAAGAKHNDSGKANHHNVSAIEQQEKLHQQQVSEAHLHEVNRQEHARKLLEIKRKKQEEIQRQKQEEKIRKMREEQEKRNREALLKEQQAKEIQRQQRVMYQQTVERERRRQHMLLIKQLESKKRTDEMNRKREEMRIIREREYEIKLEQKRLELEIMTEMRRPLEDMSLDDHKDLPELKRIPNLKLSGEAYANTLMVYEFLHNFGETLGFDMESLPSMSSLQTALLNDPETEEELLSVMIHLLVCAIDDPGIPNPQKHLTMLGQNLRQADITNTNVTEILRIYLLARAQAEMRTLHGLAPPESYAKDRNALQPEKVEEYNLLMQETQSYKLSLKVKEKTFLCLNPTDKSEILSFVCNDLLSNKNVVRQIDNNVENVTKAKKNKWEAEIKVKRLKMIQARRFNRHLFPGNNMIKHDDESTNATSIAGGHNNLESESASEVASFHGDNGDDSMSIVSESTNDVTTTVTPKKLGRPPKNASAKGKKGAAATSASRKRKATEKEEEDDEDSGSEMGHEDSHHANNSAVTGAVAVANEYLDEDERLSPEELQKKIDKSSRQLIKRRDELTFVTNCVRVNDLGQDRYRRRYWHFAHAAGIYVEALESSEPWKLPTEGMPHYDDDGRPPVLKKLKIEDSDEEDDDENEDNSNEVEDDDDHKMEVEEVKPTINGNNNDVVKKEEADEKLEDSDMANALKKLGSEIFVTSAMTPKAESTEYERKYLPKVTPNGDKLNMFNHSSHFNMQLSPVVLNGSVTITPKDTNNTHNNSSSSLNVPNLYNTQHGIYNHSNNGAPTNERPWFSILPLGHPIQHTPKLDGESATTTESSSAINTPKYPTTKFVKDDPFATPSIQERLMSLQPIDSSTPQISSLEEKLESVRNMNRDNKRVPVPKELIYGWWRLSDSHEIIELEASLNQRGIRENQLLQNIRKNLEVCQDAAKKPIPEYLELEEPEHMEDVKMLPYGCAAPDEPGSWSKEVALRVDKYILEQVEALEDKVQAASMQVPGWKPIISADVEGRKFRPACLPPPADGSKDEFGKDATNAVQEAKDRLLDLEANIERRYLKAPLGVSNSDISLQTITSSITKTSSRNSRTANNHDNNDDHHGNNKHNGSSKSDDKDDDDEAKDGDNDDDNEDEEDDKDKEVLPKGLVVWREGIRQAQTAAQVAMGFYVLETSIAWHKSIMKAFCQLCHCGDNEDSLLLCDGCDKGYHTYCFKPSIDEIPDGDWYCYECINKATGVKHCLVCGKQTGKHLVSCSSCPRAYHADCLSPALHKVPRGKWHCPGCNQKAPRKCKSKKQRLLSTHLLHPPDTEDSSTNNSIVSNSNDVKGGKEDTNDEPPPIVKTSTSNSVAASKKSSTVEDRDASPPPTPVAASPKPSEKETLTTRASRRGLSSTTPSTPPPPEKRRKLTKADRDMTVCSTIISEMEAMDDAWPFLYPVNTKQFPTYKKIIKNPMDLATIKKKLDHVPGSGGPYKTRDEFVDDVRLIFTNCELFNEDDSPVGKAGHALRTHFETRWAELTT